jgi:hypothetical protein
VGPRRGDTAFGHAILVPPVIELDLCSAEVPIANVLVDITLVVEILGADVFPGAIMSFRWKRRPWCQNGPESSVTRSG